MRRDRGGVDDKECVNDQTIDGICVAVSMSRKEVWEMRARGGVKSGEFLYLELMSVGQQCTDSSCLFDFARSLRIGTRPVRSVSNDGEMGLPFIDRRRRGGGD